MKWAMPPERLADQIVRGIRRNRSKLVVRPETHGAGWASRIAPVLTQRLIGWTYGRADRT